MSQEPVSVSPDAVSARQRPRLVYFYSRTSGPSRRVEGYISQVLQRRRNHDTFHLVRVCAETRPDLVERFGIREIPSLVVVDERRVRARLDGAHGRHEIEETLAPWLR